MCLLMSMLLLYDPRRLTLIGGGRPEEPEDTANPYAHSRIPEGKYQREQITGNAQYVVAATCFYQCWRNMLFEQAILMGGQPPEQIIREVDNREETRVDCTDHACYWRGELHRNQLCRERHSSNQQE